MNVFRDLSGGILIIIAAGVIAIAQNALRNDGIPLIPKAAVDVSEKPYTPGASGADRGASGTEQGSDPARTPAESATNATPSAADEFASGVVSRERLAELLAEGTIYLIDARIPGEYEAGHIDGAINIPYEKLPEYYDELTSTVPLDAMVVCYCQSVTCEDSENLAREMKIIGYKNVLRYKGGWDEWSQTGDPQTGLTPQH
ncbi:MAG: Rhodanese domain protein [Candidatus Krumholzibacteriota bacterium]|nr:Rhodanese domain protein [Candidatus Krumholzibacteriota bacterium]